MDCTRTTTGELLALASEDGDAAWTVFADRYRGILQATGRRLGLSPEDAEDAAQEALLKCWNALRTDGYRREAGRLRQFLLAITKNLVIDRLRRTGRIVTRHGDSVIAELPASIDELEQLIDEEFRRKILSDAMDALANRSGFNEQTVQAFQRVCFEGESADDVARELSVATQVVYNATSRCRRRLQELVEELSELYELN